MSDYDKYDLNEMIEDQINAENTDYLEEKYLELEKGARLVGQKRMNTYMQQAISAGVAEALKEMDMTPGEYTELQYTNPELNAKIAKNVAKKHTRKMINKTRQRDSQGRFVSQGQGQPERMQQGQPQQGRQPLDSEQLKAKYADQKRKGTNDEVRAMVDDMLADMF